MRRRAYHRRAYHPLRRTGPGWCRPASTGDLRGGLPLRSNGPAPASAFPRWRHRRPTTSRRSRPRPRSENRRPGQPPRPNLRRGHCRGPAQPRPQPSAARYRPYGHHARHHQQRVDGHGHSDRGEDAHLRRGHHRGPRLGGRPVRHRVCPGATGWPGRYRGPRWARLPDRHLSVARLEPPDRRLWRLSGRPCRAAR